MRCIDCGYSCHEKCMENVPKNCTKYKAVADGTTSQTLTRSVGDNGSINSSKLFYFVYSLLTCIGVFVILHLKYM